MEAFENVQDDLTVKVSPEIYEAVRDGRLTGFSVEAPGNPPGPTGPPMTVEEVRKLYEAMRQSGQELVDNQTGQSLMDMVPKRRMLATSVHGDIVWQMCQYVLAWLINFGDKDLAAQATNTRAYWQPNQQWVVDWCNDHMYFHWCELALKDTKSYAQALEMFPSEAGSVDETVRTLALLFAQDYHAQSHKLTFKKIALPRKGKRCRRRRK